MPGTVTAVITFAFDPVAHLAGLAVRWETIGVAVAVLVALVAAAVIAGSTRVGRALALRRDDLLFVVLGATAGAVVGGRIGYVVLHADYYGANRGAILDPSSGGLELSVGLVGGVLAGLVVASLLDGGARRWAATAAVPLLVALALGKAALALGGTGQGAPSGASWATAYAGAGPWGSLAPSVPSHPAQLYEAGGYLVALVVVVVSLAAVGRSAWSDGRLLGVVLVLVGLVRLAVGATWRDATVLGPLRSGQFLALAPVALGLVLVLAWRRAPLTDGRSTATEPAWPDPAIAQRWRTGPER